MTAAVVRFGPPRGWRHAKAQPGEGARRQGPAPGRRRVL